MRRKIKAKRLLCELLDAMGELEEQNELNGCQPVDLREELPRAISHLQLAQEILFRLVESNADLLQTLVQQRALALGSHLTEAQLAVVVKFLDGEPLDAIAEERGLSVRTVTNQIRTGCNKLGFKDRRELKGWSVAVKGLISANGQGNRQGE